MKEDKDDIDDEADEDTDGKRGITYQVKIPFLFVLFVLAIAGAAIFLAICKATSGISFSFLPLSQPVLVNIFIDLKK